MQESYIDLKHTHLVKVGKALSLPQAGLFRWKPALATSKLLNQYYLLAPHASTAHGCLLQRSPAHFSETTLGTVHVLKYLTKWKAKSLIFKGISMLEDVDECTQTLWNPPPNTYLHLQKSTYPQKSDMLGTKLPKSLA